MTISIIEPEELVKLQSLADYDLTILDTRVPDLYKQSHIPDAVSIQWESWSAPAPDNVKDILKTPGYWGLLGDPDEQRFSQRLGELGISDKSHIVVYADGRLSKGSEARVAWMLLYLGAKHVSMLNRGFSGWVDEGRPVQTEPVKKLRTSFEINIQPQRRIFLRDLLDTYETPDFPLLIDTRTQKEFEGRVYWYQPRMGRIPESRLVIYNTIFDEDGTSFISAETFCRLMPPELASASSAAAYCEVGVRACMIALLHEIFTGKVMPVYDGSLMEWSREANLPVVQGEQ